MIMGGERKKIIFFASLSWYDRVSLYTKVKIFICKECLMERTEVKVLICIANSLQIGTDS